MKRIPPSEKVKQAINQLLCEGLDGKEDVASMLMRLGAQRLAQELLEQEVTDFLGRDRYQRREEDEPHFGWRNGYEPARMKTAEGMIPLSVPQVREAPIPYRSRLLDFLKGNTDVLENLVAEMYARGLSTRDIEEAFREATGECLISKSAVSEVTDALWEEYEVFKERNLSNFDIHYLFLDAIYESLRRQAQAREGILCAWGITSDGAKVLLHLALGNKESYTCWLSFLRDMVRRGLKAPVSTTADGAPGLIRAIEEVFPQSLRIRCWYHKMGNIRSKLPESAAALVMAHVRTVRDAPTFEAGEQAAAYVIEKFGKDYPSAMASLSDDLKASLAHLKLPVNHRIHVRTTNLLERGFLEERRRTKVIPRFFDEKSCLKLVFATLWRASQRWQRIRVTELEQKQLDLLKQQLGLEPDPPPKRREEIKEEIKMPAA